MLGPFQSCYKKGQETQAALLGVLEETRRVMEDGKMRMIVLFDFLKAFDCIPSKLLLNKLRKMSRRQSGRDEKGCPTGYRPVASGVPQGIISGPLLFSLFIHDLSKVLRHSSCRVYADDTQFFHHFRVADIQAAIARVRTYAQLVADCATANGLKLDENKTKVSCCT